MPSSILKDLSDDGLEIIRLQNEVIGLAVAPAAGGKIIELCDRRSGYNWLWKNPNLPLQRARRDADFDSEQDTGGWDEILLSVRPATINGRDQGAIQVPDHGDLIGCEWRVDDLAIDTDGAAICAMSVQGEAANYCFTRRIRLLPEHAVIELSYALINNGESNIPAYWCAHPLFAAESPTTIAIADGLRMRIDDRATRSKSCSNDLQLWPDLQFADGSARDLSQVFARNGNGNAFASKVFVRAPENGEARVVAGEGSLLFRFNPDELPWLGIWINDRAWSGCGSEPYRNLGIEPATCPYDCVNEAIGKDAVPWLTGGEERRWSLAVELYS